MAFLVALWTQNHQQPCFVCHRESEVLGNLYMAPKDFPGNGDDGLSVQMIERAVLSILHRYFLQLEQAWN